jgi:hypothetical protein
MTPLGKFSNNVISIKSYGQLYLYISQNIPILDACELLRMQLSLAVSSLDKYIHDKLVEQYTKNISLDEVINNGIVTFSSKEISTLIYETDQSVRKSQMINIIIQKLNVSTFQRPDAIQKAAKSIGIKDFWNKMSCALRLDSARVQGQLKLIIERRNKIVHESDYDEIAMAKRCISETDVKISRAPLKTHVF